MKAVTTVWPRPIPVGERLPEPNGLPVLVFEALRQQWYEGLITIKGEFVIPGHSLDAEHITHWLAMPPKPE